MRRLTIAVAGLVVALGLVAFGCSDSNSSDDNDPGPLSTDTSVEATEPPPVDTGDATEQPDDGVDQEPGLGAATLTIGDETWTFSIVSCSLTPEDAPIPDVSFTMGSFLSDDGERVELDVTIQDANEEGRYEGAGVTHAIGLIDLENVEPDFLWYAASDSDPFIHVDGTSVSAEAVFDDQQTSAVEEEPGTLEGTCP